MIDVINIFANIGSAAAPKYFVAFFHFCRDEFDPNTSPSTSTLGSCQANSPLAEELSYNFNWVRRENPLRPVASQSA
jgi:hypothetical protein